MSKEKKRGGIAPVLFLFCAVLGGTGAAFDAMSRSPRGFWIGAEPGMAAAIGAGAALFVIAAGFISRKLLSRPALVKKPDA